MSNNSRHLEAAQALIPWGTQTNAKRIVPAMAETQPAFIKRGRGCHIWDLDDKKYIDFRCALGPIILGYCNPHVDAAVAAELKNGTLFSMASPLELETARTFVEAVPWVENLRFLKTGGDANTACLRLARAFTGRDHFISGGYHGYHDAFATEWPDAGIPKAVADYTHHIAYNDRASAERLFDRFGPQLAAVIIEPYDWGPVDGAAYLKFLRQKCDEYGTLLIFDEVLTGFRLAKGGAQEFYGVTPDLAAFAKAMANGYPISAFGGRREVMQQLNKTVITTTYAGETLSLAACRATLNVMQNEPVHTHINEMGAMLKDGFSRMIKKHGIPGCSAGVHPAPYIDFEQPTPEENLRMQERLFKNLFAEGVYPSDRWFINYAHQEEDIENTIAALDRSLAKFTV